MIPSREVVLSPRKLHIHGNTVVWSCAASACDDKFCQPIAPSSTQQQHQKLQFGFYKSPGGGSEVDIGTRYASWEDESSDVFKSKGSDRTAYRTQLLLQQWYDYVGDYLHRMLSVPSDRLPAISAVANDMQEQLNFDYYAGIWLQDVPVGLAWCTDGLASLTEMWRSPSWSWAALEFQPVTETSVLSQNDIYEWHFEKEDGALKLVHGYVNSNVHRPMNQPTPLHVEGNTLYYKDWPKTIEISQSISNRFSQTNLLCEFDCPREGRPYITDHLHGLLLLRLGTWYDQDQHDREKYFQEMEERESREKRSERRVYPRCEMITPFWICFGTHSLRS